MKVVIDCNVLVSAARSQGVCGRVMVEAMRYHEVVLSEPIVEEYEAIAGRLTHAPYRDGLLAIIGVLEQVAIMVEPTNVTFGVADPDGEVYRVRFSCGGGNYHGDSGIIISLHAAFSPFRDKIWPHTGVLSANPRIDRIPCHQCIEITQFYSTMRDLHPVYLATAMAGDAVLITGNSRHFTQARYGSVEVLSPRTFLDRTTGGAASEH